MRSLRRLLAYTRDWRGRYLRGTVYAVTNKLFDIAPEILIGVAVDIVVQREESFLAGFGVASLEGQLVLLGVLTVLVWGGESIFEYLYQVVWKNLAQTVQHQVRADVFDHVQHLPAASLDRRRRGELQTLLTEDVNQLERFLNTGLVAILHVVTSTIAVGIVFFALSPGVAVFAMLPIPLIVLVALAFQRGLGRRYGAVRESAGTLGARLSSQLHGLLTIKSYTAEAQALRALEADSRGYEATNRKAIKLSSAFVPLIRMAILSGFVVTLVVGGFRTLDGTLAVGAYSVLVFLTQRLLWPFTRLGETVDLYQRSMASANRLLDVLDLEREDPGGERVDPAVFRGDVRFEGVSFTYPSEEQRAAVFEGLDLTIPAGSFVGLVGSTGSGKSTLVKLLLRFYAPDAGQVTLGGVDLSELPLRELRRQVAWVSQEAFLFHGTVRENIALGDPEASRERVIAAAKAAELHEFVASLPKGYDTQVGDFGASLSGGQRQRLSLARAILKDPPILILDEATSAVDNETEAAIQRSLARVAEGRTVIAIAHRLSTVRGADAIFVLEQGQLIERGRHDALVEGGGRYAGLWAMQVGAA